MHVGVSVYCCGGLNVPKGEVWLSTQGYAEPVVVLCSLCLNPWEGARGQMEG